MYMDVLYAARGMDAGAAMDRTTGSLPDLLSSATLDLPWSSYAARGMDAGAAMDRMYRPVSAPAIPALTKAIE